MRGMSIESFESLKASPEMLRNRSLGSVNRPALLRLGVDQGPELEWI